MKSVSLLIKPASSNCNMKCKYCFYEDVSDNRSVCSFGKMNNFVVDNIIDKVINYFKENVEINFCFQGGEPTLASIEYFEYFIEQVNKYKKEYHNVNYSIQTNGLIIDDKWVKLFKENNFLVGVSLDGFKTNHDSIRIDKFDDHTFDKIIKNINLLRFNEVDFNILTVLTKGLSKHPMKLFEFYKRSEFRFIQIIPCMPSLNNNKEMDEYAISPKDFCEFYKSFFDVWFNEYQKDNYISVGLFDNIIPMYANIHPTTCGMLGKCSFQYVVESDGSVYPCDFYVLDEYKIGNICEDTLVDLAKNKLVMKFIEENKRTCNLCEKCEFKLICNGNCKRLNVCYYDEDYCGYKEFLKYTKNRMQMVAKE